MKSVSQLLIASVLILAGSQVVSPKAQAIDPESGTQIGGEVYNGLSLAIEGTVAAGGTSITVGAALASPELLVTGEVITVAGVVIPAITIAATARTKAMVIKTLREDAAEFAADPTQAPTPFLAGIIDEIRAQIGAETSSQVSDVEIAVALITVHAR